MKTIVTALLVLAAAAPAGAQSGSARDLSQASLADLLNMRVTSASRKEQRAEDVPAAVYVITSEQIRRSGLTSLPEILRLAPGVQVAQISNNRWAVSVRGFNGMFANKLLVLVDGRSVYSRSFGGVIWDALDPAISDIERIEVIRGPGGAMWGANAMNGVINIVTRSASSTTGLSVEASLGTVERDRLHARYGGSIGNTAYRVFTQWSGYADSRPSRESIDDDWSSLTAGARVDWSDGPDAIAAVGQFTNGQAKVTYVDLVGADGGMGPYKGAADMRQYDALARWRHTFGAGSLLQVQAFGQSSTRDDLIVRWSERVVDVDAQYEADAGAHAIVIGSGFRSFDLSTTATPALSLAPEQSQIFNGFVQDDISLPADVILTVGGKTEYDSEAGWGLLPSARVMWSPHAEHRLWAAVSRARRTPSATDRTMRVRAVSVPTPAGLVIGGHLGNPDYRPETLLAAEAGYRVRFGSRGSVEVTGFRGSYDNLPSGQPQPPAFELTPWPHVFVAERLENLRMVTTTGMEVNGDWLLTRDWRVSGSYTALRLRPQLNGTSGDQQDAPFDGHAPRHQWQIRSTTSPADRLEFDVSLYYTGRLRVLQLPAYARLDMRAEWKLSPRLSAIVSGRNLLDGDHVEFPGTGNLFVTTPVPRSALVQLRWR